VVCERAERLVLASRRGEGVLVDHQEVRTGVDGASQRSCHTETDFFNQVLKLSRARFFNESVNSLTTTLASRLAQTMKARAHEKVDAAAAAHQRHVSRVDLVEQKAASRCVFSAFHLIHTPHCCRPSAALFTPMLRPISISLD